MPRDPFLLVTNRDRRNKVEELLRISLGFDTPQVMVSEPLNDSRVFVALVVYLVSVT